MAMSSKKYKVILSIIATIIISIISSVITIIIYNTKTNDSANYYDENINKIVEVAAYDEEDNKSYGTGWFFNENTIVTNYHVLSYLLHSDRIEFNEIEIRFYDEEDYEKVSIISFDEIKDIAFLQYNGDHYHKSFDIQNEYSNTERCFTIGNFSNYGLSYKKGYISLEKVNLLYNNEYYEFIQSSICIGQGDSGAPLINMHNKVIGMITFRTKGINGTVEQGYAYAIPISRIIELYSKNV